MIDIQTLSARMAFDTSVLLPAFSNPPVDRREECRELFDTAARSGGIEIIIPSPCLTEVLRGGKNERPPRTRNVFVVDFDEDAALLLATQFSLEVLKKFIAKGQEGSSIHYKYDALIVATAIQHGATVLVTHDDDQRKLAALAGLKAKKVEEFQGVETQPSLPWPKPPK